jgi:hypothetical protein
VFSKILVANRGEIAVRAFRAATELGAKTVAVFPHEDRKSEHRLKADESYQIGEEGHPVRAYLDHDNIVRVVGGVRCGRDLPGLRLPVGEPAARRGLRCQRHHLHRAAGRGAAPDRQQGQGDRRCPSGRAAHPQECAGDHRPRPSGGGRRGHRVPGLRQGREWRRRAWHAPGGQPGDPARFPRGRATRGRRGLRRPDALPGAGRHQPAAHRGAGARRRRGHRLPPLRTRLFPAASPPEGHRDRPRAQPRPRHPGADVRGCRGLRRVNRLSERGHGRVPPR